MKRLTAMAIAAACGCMSSAALSQVRAEKSPSDSLTTPIVTLSEVTVMVQRADQKTPIAVTNLSAAELAAANTGRDIPYLLQMVPSVVTTSDAGAGIGYSSIRIRGTEGSRINVTANGIPVNDSESHNVYWVNMPDLSSSLHDIQIQRGVGTSTVGAGAFGASINMATDRPGVNPYASFDGSIGMYGTHKETLRIGTGLMGGKFTVDARLSNIGTDGYIDRASARLNSYFAQAGWYGSASSLRFVVFGGSERTYMAWDYASKEEMELYGRRYNPCGEYTDSQGNIAYYHNQYDNYALHNFQLLFKHNFGAGLTLDAALHYTKGDGYYEQYKTRRTLIEYGLQPFVVDGEKVKKSDLIRLKKMDNDFGGGLVNLNWHHESLTLTAGAAVNSYVGRHFGQIAWVRNYIGAIDPLQEYYRNIGHKFDASAYARAGYDITSNLTGYLDLQYRHIRYTIRGNSDTYNYATDSPQVLDIHTDYNFFNPKAGLNYTFLGHNRVYASVAVAHREPTRDNFVDADPGREPRAERLLDYELGYQYRGDRWKVGAGLYYMDYKDQLVATGQLSDTGNAISVNVPKSYRCGIELEGALKPCDWFEWQLNATISRNRIHDFIEYIYEDEWTNPITVNHGSSRIAFSPDFTLNNAFNFAWHGFDASLQSHYVSRQYLSNAEQIEQSLDPYFVSDLIVGYTFSLPNTKSVRVGLTVNNLFSARYFSNGYAGAGYTVGDDGVKHIYRYAGFAAQAPANILGSISVKF